MVTEAPACKLDAKSYQERLSLIAEVGGAALLEARETAAGTVLSFTNAREVREQLEAIVAAESKCCPFLALSIHDEANELSLTITAPAEAQPVVRELVDSFVGRKETS
jgi:hypothetical protein